jgi:hypothetical protein
MELAEDRLEKHFENENARRAAGLPTDMQRYLDGGVVRD